MGDVRKFLKEVTTKSQLAFESNKVLSNLVYNVHLLTKETLKKH